MSKVCYAWVKYSTLPHFGKSSEYLYCQFFSRINLLQLFTWFVMSVSYANVQFWFWSHMLYEAISFTSLFTSVNSKPIFQMILFGSKVLSKITCAPAISPHLYTKCVRRNICKNITIKTKVRKHILNKWNFMYGGFSGVWSVSCDLQGLLSEIDNLCRVNRNELQLRDVKTSHTWRRVFADTNNLWLTLYFNCEICWA